MSSSLYRKYRPSSFDQVIGQDYIKQTIQNEIKTNKLSHAYLFSGPRGVGKTTLARLIAKAVNCKNRKDGQSEPCNECDSCLEINKNRSMNLVEVDAASNRGIDDVRELRDKVRFAPSGSKFKVFIIDEAHMLTKDASNALLKTLEEPPAHAIFVLATTEIHKILETIISRCQRFDFKRVDFKDIVKRLEKISKEEGYKVDKEVFENIAYHSEGHPRDAESTMSQVLSVADGNKVGMEELKMVLPASNLGLVIEFIEDLLNNDIKKSLKLVNKTAQDGIDLKNFTSNVTKMLHKMILTKAGLGEMTWQVEKNIDKKIHKLSKDVENRQLVLMIEVLNQAKQELENYVLNQIALEIAILKICDKKEKTQKDDSDDDEPKHEQTSGLDQSENQDIEKDNSKGFIRSKIDQIESKVEQKIKQAKDAKKQDIKSDQEVETSEDKIESKESIISMYEIKGKWPQVVRRIGDKNRSLVAMLEVCEIKGFEKKCLTLTFPYKFYIDKIKEASNIGLIEEVLFEVLNAKVSINSELGDKTNIDLKLATQSQVENTEETKKENDPQMGNLLEAFGGEIVG